MSHRRNLRTAAVGDSVDVLETEMTRLARTITLLGRPPEAASGVDRAGYLLLRTLERIGPASINTIAAAVGLDGSTVTRQVAAMKELGLVERATNPGDRRSCIISPTSDGRAVMRQMRRQRRSNLDAVTSDWTDDDRSALGRLLAKLNDSIARATSNGDAVIAQSAG
ncbi:MAG TPA: MarR family winged helix-turn-helix transcriptional regulator [Pseudonocardiaceae bacterium]|nr:MarR family winged helix-turn-helix transcriptional regulator [Pseudonocardiaceae bacterium]